MKGRGARDEGQGTSDPVAWSMEKGSWVAEAAPVRWWRRWWRALWACAHDPRPVPGCERVVEGVTMDWGGGYAVSYRTRVRCAICGTEYEQGGWLFPLRWWEHRAADGWPLLEDGTRMPMVGGTGG